MVYNNWSAIVINYFLKPRVVGSSKVPWFFYQSSTTPFSSIAVCTIWILELLLLQMDPHCYLPQSIGWLSILEAPLFEKTIINHHGSTCILRLLLAQLGFFGDVEELGLPDRLVIAFKDFKAWCKQNKVQSSHPMFTVGSATLLIFGHVWTSSDLF